MEDGRALNQVKPNHSQKDLLNEYYENYYDGSDRVLNKVKPNHSQ
jgi:hypothetical protein